MLRTRSRDPEIQTLRPTGVETLTRTNALKPARNKQITAALKASSTPSGLRAEVTTDENHGQPPYNEGGPFCSVKLWYPDFAVAGYTVQGKNITQPNSTTGAFEPGDVWTRSYSGALMLSQGWAYMSTALGERESKVRRPEDADPVVNPDDLSSLAPRAWNKLRPKVEKAGLAQGLIELREAPRMLTSTAKSAVRSWHALKAFQRSTQFRRQRSALGRIPDLRRVPKPVAEEFLNVQFGWKPFVREIVGVLDVVINLEEHIENTTRRNNQWQKRYWSEEVVESSNLVHSEGGLALSRIAPIQGSNWFKDWSTNYMVYRESHSQVWYEGKFKFYRPEFDAGLAAGYPAVKRARQTLSLLGGNITPTVLWKVTPWTWLADWFGNLGDNIQALEDLVSGQVAAKYAYIMRYTYDQYRYVTTSQTHGGVTVSVEATRRLEVKRRVSSMSPFGFALSPTGLSGGQLAILGALGLSR